MSRVYQLTGVLFLAAALHGCVFQPIHVEVSIPTTATVGGSVALDAHKDTTVPEVIFVE